MSLTVRVHRYPIEIEGAIGAGRRAKAGVRHQLVAIEDTKKFVIARWCIIEKLEGHRDFVGAEDGRGVEDLPQAIAVSSLQRAEPHRRHGIQWSPTAKRSNDGKGGSVALGIPESFCAKTQPSSTEIPPRFRSRPSSHIVRPSEGYSIPATPAIRPSPASGAMSGFALTSRIHGLPAESMRMSTRP